MLDEAERDGDIALEDTQVPTWRSPDVQKRARPIGARVGRTRPLSYFPG
jgi:hypothetical protein